MWYRKNEDEVLKELSSNMESGLDLSEVNRRIAEFGHNKLTEKKKKSIILKFFEQFNDVLIYVLIVAAIISVVLGEYSDAIIIMIVVVINAVIGVVQEYRAEQAMDALKKLSSPKAYVKRENKVTEIPSEEIVPGDIIVLDAGRYIPCDIRILESANLKIEESALTGESVPVDKVSSTITGSEEIALGDQKNMAFMSTFITYGRGIGVATATGMKTEIGKIAEMLSEEDNEETPLQKNLTSLGKILALIAIVICAIIFVVGIIQGRDIKEMFFIAVSLAVAAIPEGLVAIVTIVLAMGMQKMIKVNALVRKLTAVETLGAVNVICSDKTGTLTQNKMTVLKYYLNGEIKEINELKYKTEEEKLLVNSMVLCNDATSTKTEKTGDPTEIALIDVGNNIEIYKDSLENEFKRIDEIPFESDRKLMTTVNENNKVKYAFTKGAVDNLIELCNKIIVGEKVIDLTADLKNKILNSANKMSDQALRVLASSYKIINDNNKENYEKDLTFIGLMAMIDPPRPEVKDAIVKCKGAGIKTIMITGDHKNTAVAIAKELDLAKDESEAIFGYELDKLTDEELKSKVDNLRVYARVSPEHKVRIVKAIKSRGNVVSMTGDGVNDAPSLKAADIGVAMGITGTDVSKGAADMILTDDNFTTIVSAVETGRNIFNNIKKAILFLLSCNLGEIFSLFFAIMLGWPTPLEPTHILWVNLVTDSFPALSLGMEASDKDVMKEAPRNVNESFLTKHATLLILLGGLLIGILTLVAFALGIYFHTGSFDIVSHMKEGTKSSAIIYAQTMAFMVLSTSQLFFSLNMRNLNKSIFKIGLFTNKYLIGAVLFGILIQVAVINIPVINTAFNVIPLLGKDLAVVILLSITPIIVGEIFKVIYNKISR